MKTTNKSEVQYVQHMGSDETICDAARVSFDKQAKDYEHDKNVKLISYLARHNHWSPFAHTSIQIRVSTPIFVARQLGKHQVGLTWNEISRRYVDEEPEFYFPDVWRKRAENVKQGSSSEDAGISNDLDRSVFCSVMECVDDYNRLLVEGVAPEQARMILPQNMMTTFIWTGSLHAFARVYKQRTDSHAQAETQEVANKIGDICAELFPVAWKALTNPSTGS